MVDVLKDWAKLVMMAVLKNSPKPTMVAKDWVKREGDTG